ncbi:hypothetical protein [uncultured Litoreibacter sp.]|uniref:hypothetical protein n=1 Tax=uncultured Litoreibacter sp. TaxID=1392394 RepID=UPI00261B24DF|nr:hypothetical protein [uncultured Litoreibacter sp.]
MVPLLIGIIIAAAVFAAFLWSLYRAVMTKGRLRVNYAVMAISTLLVVAGITWNLAALTFAASVSLIVSAAIGVWADQKWSKLLPLVQMVLGVLSFFAATDVLIQGGLSTMLQNGL